MRRLAVGLLVALAACGRSQTLQVPVATDTLPEEPVAEAADTGASYVSAPIVLDSRALLADLEALVPRRIGSVEKRRRIRVGGTPAVYVAPELVRGPFALEFEGTEAFVSTVVEYRARAWVKIPFSVGFSCGIEGPRPRLRLRLALKFDLTDDWHLRTRSRVLKVAPYTDTERDQCEVSALKIDVSGRIADEGGKALQDALETLDRKARGVDLGERMAGLWGELQQPIDLMHGRLWLHIRPRAVALGPVEASDSTLTAYLRLRAGPVILGGSRPAPDTLPLPPLGRTDEAADSADVRMEGRMTYEAATAMLRRELAGEKLGRLLRRRVVLEDVAVRYAGRGRLLIAATLSGRANGTVYLVGTPVYDPSSDLIRVPDLAFDVMSEGYLENVAAWLIKGPYLEDLRARVRLPAGALLEEVVTLANQEINRELAEGVRLRGELQRAHALGVRARRDGIVAQARGLGTLRLEIARDRLLPDRLALRVKPARAKD